VNGLNLKFEPGKFYALVGESGAGKSTIISLLLRFYDPQQGRVLLDGKDLKEIQQFSLREQIAIVNQDLFPFHATPLRATSGTDVWTLRWTKSGRLPEWRVRTSLS